MEPLKGKEFRKELISGSLKSFFLKTGVHARATILKVPEQLL